MRVEIEYPREEAFAAENLPLWRWFCSPKQADQGIAIMRIAENSLLLAGPQGAWTVHVEGFAPTTHFVPLPVGFSVTLRNGMEALGVCCGNA